MKRFIIYLLIVITLPTLIIIFAGMYKFNYLANLLGYDHDGNRVPEAEIMIQNRTIYFKGMTEEANYDLLLAEVLKYPDIKFRKIIINSEGGHTIYGRKIANFILENQLDVEVEEICFSSCANYIFPAGKTKYIQKNAVIGWHGSEFQSLLLKRQNQSVEEYIKEMLRNALARAGSTDEDILEKEYKKFLGTLIDEWSFFKKIKTNIVIALHGLDKLSDDLPYHGWTYSVEDMKKFGLKDIVYLGEKNTYPKFQPKHNGKIFVEIYDDKRVKEIELIISKYMKTTEDAPPL